MIQTPTGKPAGVFFVKFGIITQNKNTVNKGKRALIKITIQIRQKTGDFI